MSGQDRVGSGAGNRLWSGSSEDLYRDLARRLDLPFASRVSLGPGAAAHPAAIRAATVALQSNGGRILYLAPEAAKLAAIRGWIEKYPEARHRVAIAAPSAIRAALIERSGLHLARESVTRLARRDPLFSARRTLTGRQAIAGVGLAAATLAALLTIPVATLFVLNFIAALFFFGVGVLRFLAAGRLARYQGPRRRIPFHADDSLPVYTVLVPLFGEARIVPGLVAALEACAADISMTLSSGRNRVS